MTKSKNTAKYREAAQIETLDSIIKDHVLFAMRFYLGDKQRAAAGLGISLKTLYNYLHEWGVPLDYPLSARLNGTISVPTDQS